VERVDLLKLDVEGSEHAILAHEASLEFLRRRVAFVLLEVHPRGRRRDVEDMRARLRGFEVLSARRRVLLLRNRALDPQGRGR